MVLPTRMHILTIIAVVMALLPLSAGASHSYVVQPGDTLSAIAARHNTSVAALVEANAIADPNLIYPGQTLMLPHAAPDPVPAAAEPTVPPEADSAASLLNDTAVVTYYGNPFSSQMGILGELSQQALVDRLRDVAAEYGAVTGRPVKPAIEMVATVAQSSPGPDGMARARMPAEIMQQYADLAAANDMLFIIDLQIGHSDWATEIEAMRPFLSQPHVHLAMDPEFDMAPGQQPGEAIGSTSAEDINHAIRYLSGLTGELNLPPKMLFVHQFTPDMIRDKDGIEDLPRVDIVIVMDGFGSQEAKISHYNAFVRDQPVEYAGIKLFYRQDVPLFTPAQVMSLEPQPSVVIYQ